MAVSLSEADRAMGYAIYSAVLNSQTWIHRKVETLDMLDDEQGRRRVSIDCTPVIDPRLRIDPDGVGPASGTQVYLPIAILSKVQIRDLDLRDAGGAAVPMTERSTFEFLEVSAMVAALERCGNSVDDELIADLNRIVRSKEDAAIPIADALVSGDKPYDGLDIATVPPSLRHFIRDLAAGFLLVAVVPEALQGVRTVLKYSAYWPQPETFRPTWKKPASRAAHALALYLRRIGWFPFHYHVDVSGGAFAASYHIQVKIPEGLSYDRMELPRAEGDSARVDVEQGRIAHGGAHFAASADSDAVLVLRNPANGRLRTVLAIGILTIAILSLFTWTPLIELVSRNPTNVESALGLLLVLPAGLIAIGSRNRDNRVAASATAALRVTADILAACYVSLAVVLVVFGEQAQFVELLHWVFFAIWGVAIAVTLPVVVGYTLTVRRDLAYQRLGDPDSVRDYHRVKVQAGPLWRRIGVEEPIFRVETIESRLTVLGGIGSLSSSALEVAVGSARSIVEGIAAGWDSSWSMSTVGVERDRRVRQAAERSVSARTQVIGRDGSSDVFPATKHGEVDLEVGHVKGKRTFPAAETVDHIVAVTAPGGSLARPPGEWMTMVVVGGDSQGLVDPKAPVSEVLRRVAEFRAIGIDELAVVVPEGSINDRVVRLVGESRARRVVPERAAIHDAIDVMTGTSEAHVFYGTVGASEGMAIAAAARVLGVAALGSFGSPDLLASVGGIGRFSGFYSATELVNSPSVGVVVASVAETDVLQTGMTYPSRQGSAIGAGVMILGGDRFDPELTAAVVAATEAAAAAARRWVGKKDKTAVDAAAVDAMRARLRSAPFRGVVVIGEGEKDRAPMLANGEVLGNGSGGHYDVAVDPLDGTRLAAAGIPGSICTVALAEEHTMFDPRDVFYMEKLITGPAGRGAVDLRRSASENVSALAAGLGIASTDITVAVLDKPRHAALVAELRAVGTRVRLLGEGDVAPAVAAASGVGDIHAVIGVGGTPEGIIAACAVRALGGFMQARLAPQSDEQRRMALAAGHDLDRIFELDDLIATDRVLFVSNQVI